LSERPIFPFLLFSFSSNCTSLGWCRRREKIDWQEPRQFDLIVGWCGRFLFFVVPRQFSLDIGRWSENQILIPDWTYFHCPDAIPKGRRSKIPEEKKNAKLQKENIPQKQSQEKILRSHGKLLALTQSPSQHLLLQPALQTQLGLAHTPHRIGRIAILSEQICSAQKLEEASLSVFLSLKHADHFFRAFCSVLRQSGC